MRTDLLVNNFVLRSLRDTFSIILNGELMGETIYAIQDALQVFPVFVIGNWEKCKNETYNVGHDLIEYEQASLAQKINQHIPLEIIRAEINTDPDVGL